MHNAEKHWTLVIVSLFAVFIPTGCRIGNQVTYNTPSSDTKTSKVGQVSGYYSVLPESLKFYAITSADPKPIVKDASTLLIPNELGTVMTDPVTLILQDSATGKATLSSPEGSTEFPVNLKSDNTLSFSGTSTPKIFWLDPACTSTFGIYEDGKLIINSKVSHPNSSHYPISGSMDLSVQIVRSFDGDCTATLQAVYQCYQDPTHCGGVDDQENLDLQAAVISLFAPWIQSHTFQPSDIPNLTTIAYEVSYH